MVQDIQHWVGEIKHRLDSSGLKLSELLLAAEVNHSTFWRWENGQAGAHTKTIGRVEEALERLLRKQHEGCDVSHDAKHVTALPDAHEEKATAIPHPETGGGA